MAITIYQGESESSVYTAEFAPAHSDGTGRMVVTLLPSLRGSTRSEFYYYLKASIDGTVVYGPHKVGCPIVRGRSITHDDALLEAVQAAIEHGSLFEASRGEDWINTNPRAAEFSAVWEFADAELTNEFARRRKQRPLLGYRTSSPSIGIL